MSRLVEYLTLAQERPELFVNSSQGGFTILLEEDEIREVEAYMAQKLTARGLSTEWAHVGIVFQDQHGRILRDAVRFPGGALGTYIRFIGDTGNAPYVIILPHYQESILLIRRFHHATRSSHIELLLGEGEKGLSGQENAQRKLAQDIGATASRLVSLGEIDEGPGVTPGKTELFFAEVEGYGIINKHKGISEVFPVTIQEFERMIGESEITDSYTIVTYLYAKLEGLL